MRSPLVAGVRGARRTIHTSTIRRDSELGGLKDLMAQFQNPSSPFHIAPGSSGPASPDDRTSSQALPSSSSTSSSPSGPSRTEEGEQLYAVGKQAGMDFFRKDGWDTRGILEWPVAWGDCDMFQHANNVQFVRWFESARIRYVESFADDLPSGMVESMRRGKGTGFILKDVSIRYRQPVTYPDSLIISNRPHSIDGTRASFRLASAFWSLKASKLVATGDSTMVMYDYDNLKKGVMVDVFREALERRENSVGTV